MSTQNRSPAIIVFFIILLVLSFAFALLPSGNVDKGQKRQAMSELDYSIAVKKKSPESSKQNQLATFTHPKRPQLEAELTSSSSDLLVTTVMDTPTESEKIVKQDELIHASAVTKNDIEECDKITNQRTINNCRDTIYFQEAVTEENPDKCELIISNELKSSCQNYTNLTNENVE